jgi:hypothetical protein
MSKVANLANVTGMQPAVGVNGLRRLFRLIVIALKDAHASDANLATWIGLVCHGKRRDTVRRARTKPKKQQRRVGTASQRL